MDGAGSAPAVLGEPIEPIEPTEEIAIGEPVVVALAASPRVAGLLGRLRVRVAESQVAAGSVPMDGPRVVVATKRGTGT